MKIAQADILFVPGRSRVKPDHWQARWSARMPNASWVEPTVRSGPDFEDRIDGLHRAIMMATRPVVLVAHSLGVISVAHTATRLVDTKVRGALLVAPPDLDNARKVPTALRPFAPAPREPLPFPSLLIASANDPNCDSEHAADLASAWGAQFHDAGEAGHINTASGHGPWPEGMMMLSRLMQRL